MKELKNTNNHTKPIQPYKVKNIIIKINKETKVDNVEKVKMGVVQKKKLVVPVWLYVAK